MKIIFPDYYESFRCTASACRHNCCIGWEIDIDEESLAYYRSVGGEFGRRLKKNISPRGTPHFILGEHERCPFLNGANLCDIYAELGEEHLCGICSDHPRFRNFFSGSTELGLGLCCEAVCELLMSREEPVRFLFSEDDEPEEAGDELEKNVLKSKYEILGILQDRRLPMAERMKKAMELCGVRMPGLRPAELARFFLSLERLDGEWTKLLEGLKEAEHIDFTGYERYAGDFEYEYEQLAVYFVYRHFGAELYEGCKAGAMGLAALSVYLLYTLAAEEFTRKGEISPERRRELARM